MKKTFLLLGLLATLLCSCNNSSSKNKSDIPYFNSDSCYMYVQQQVDFGARVPNTAAHDSCAQYLKNHFERLGLETTMQKAELTAYDGTILNATNIIASVNPENKNRIFLCAHWDSRPVCDEDSLAENRTKPVLGANDGASGVAVLMELARLTAADAPEIGIDFVLFDAEDYGSSDVADSYCLGSQYWAKNLDKKQYKPAFGILLDMVGAADAVFYKEGVSQHYGQHVVNLVWQRAHELGYGSVFYNASANPIIDDHYYINTISGIPCIDIVHYSSQDGFPSTWHTTNDNMENISQSTLSVVGDVLTHIIYETE